MKAPKKLIEVALPLDDINAAAAREKSIRHGHPSTLHLWWARRPLAAARAVLFAQLVNDPGGERGWGNYPGQTKADAQRERERLFGILRELVKWENTNNEQVLEQAREEIRKSWRETCRLNNLPEDTEMPPLHDPFAGGGAIPLEAQRLGLKAIASDLNPVAVLINKAMIEIPSKFAGRAPIGPIPEGETQTEMPKSWPGATGLAEDVRRYGHWMRKEAFKRIGHLYPPVHVVQNPDGTYRHATEAELNAQPRTDTIHRVPGSASPRAPKPETRTVIAWLWARTVASPNPALGGVHVPLISSFWLSKKKGKEVYIEPVVEGTSYRFEIRHGKPGDAKKVDGGTKVGRGSFQCILSSVPVSSDYIKTESKAGRMKARMMAIVAEGDRQRIYLPPDDHHESIAQSAEPSWRPDQPFPENSRHATPTVYGFKTWADLFTDRQLVALTTFSDIAQEIRELATNSSLAVKGENNNGVFTDESKERDTYDNIILTYLSFAIDKCADTWSTICSWIPQRETLRSTFARQAIPMVWDFAEVNPLSRSTGNISSAIEWIEKCIQSLPGKNEASCLKMDAATRNNIDDSRFFSTDPPYYDNVPYADLSDFFYVWLRKSLKNIYPRLLDTVLVPKTEELIAEPFRHGGKIKAEEFFLAGMTKAMRVMATNSHFSAPVAIYYAFKQSESGWETFLESTLTAGFSITGTWPMHTERSARTRGIESNALASSIVLVCRPRPDSAPEIPRRQFLRELEETMPEALEAMIGGTEGASPIAPVDLAQAAIGPGMAVFSKYAAVLEADGSRMKVRDALAHINRAIDRYFSQAEGQMDADTRFCVDWFQQFGFKAGAFGEADVLARAKGTSVEGLEAAGVLESGGGKVRLFKVNEYPAGWDPERDTRTPVWEACHQMARALQTSESSAGELLARMPEKQEPVRQLAYRLYTLCERKGWAEEARQYNLLVGSWHGIVEQSHEKGRAGTQTELDL